nr:MAG TPA: hypothetical protein [Caudoviricetes sp.]
MILLRTKRISSLNLQWSTARENEDSQGMDDLARLGQSLQ